MIFFLDFLHLNAMFYAKCSGFDKKEGFKVKYGDFIWKNWDEEHNSAVLRAIINGWEDSAAEGPNRIFKEEQHFL